jgi:hypothetical protein
MSNDDKPDNPPDVVTAACRFCEGQADGLDRLCTPCRAESACTGLAEDLTDALEEFLDARWSPHEYGRRPAYYLDAPAFGGDPLVYDAKIAAACQQIAAGAKQLIELALGRPVSAEIRPKYYLATGFHALLDFDELDKPVLHLVKS